MVGAAFPIGEGVWIAGWCAFAALLAIGVLWRLGLLRQKALDQSSLLFRFALRRGMALIMLPVVLLGWFAYDPVRAVWNEQFGACIQLVEPGDAARFLRLDVEPDVWESERSCTVRFDGPTAADHGVMRVEVETFGVSSGAFESQASRRSAPIQPAGSRGWPRRIQVFRDDKQLVVNLELARDAALIMTIRQSMSDVQLERLIRLIATRESVLDPIVRRR